MPCLRSQPGLFQRTLEIEETIVRGGHMPKPVLDLCAGAFKAAVEVGAFDIELCHGEVPHRSKPRLVRRVIGIERVVQVDKDATWLCPECGFVRHFHRELSLFARTRSS